MVFQSVGALLDSWSVHEPTIHTSEPHTPYAFHAPTDAGSLPLVSNFFMYRVKTGRKIGQRHR